MALFSDQFGPAAFGGAAEIKERLEILWVHSVTAILDLDMKNIRSDLFRRRKVDADLGGSSINRVANRFPHNFEGIREVASDFQKLANSIYFRRDRVWFHAPLLKRHCVSIAYDADSGCGARSARKSSPEDCRFWPSAARYPTLFKQSDRIN